MVGLNKINAKNKREQRRRNHIARDLESSKYHQRVIPDRRRIGNEEGGKYYLIERYLDDDE